MAAIRRSKNLLQPWFRKTLAQLQAAYGRNAEKIKIVPDVVREKERAQNFLGKDILMVRSVENADPVKPYKMDARTSGITSKNY